LFSIPIGVGEKRGPDFVMRFGRSEHDETVILLVNISYL
jgi:hypothetical protein